jgi:hypothetical protein
MFGFKGKMHQLSERSIRDSVAFLTVAYVRLLTRTASPGARVSDRSTLEAAEEHARLQKDRTGFPTGRLNT